jgi:hypothetical protein
MQFDRKIVSRLGRVVLKILAIAAVAGFIIWFNLFRTKEVSAEVSSSGREHFLYGSIGTEGLEGTPYWIWMVLPSVFPEYLPGPGGYTSLGLSWEPGQELPMGITKKFIGVDRVGLNCAFCHVSQVRTSAEQPTVRFYLGGPSHQFRAQEYQQFMFKSAGDPRFNADVLMTAIGRVTKLSLREALLYRYMLIPAMRKAVLEQRDDFAWQHAHGRPPQGPGRVDPFNPVRFIVFKEPDDGSVGNADIPAIWNQRARTSGYLHWDGLSKKLSEVAISSAIGDGAREQYLDVASLDKVERFLMDLPPPRYPLSIDRRRAELGGVLYAEHCASCHAQTGDKLGKITPLAEIGTDPSRAQSWTESQVAGWKQLAVHYQRKHGASWKLDSFAKPGGYVNGLLDGIWLRGPYLHNGSVPSLRALLDDPAERPKRFYRGYELVDAVKVGFVSDVAESQGRKFFLYDTALRGNTNRGHVYGTKLEADQKDALVEFMKTL